jgi:hypothetical protein
MSRDGRRTPIDCCFDASLIHSRRAVSKDGPVALAANDALKVPVHSYPEFVAIAGKYCFQIGPLSGNPGEEVSELLSLAMLGRRHQHQLWPLPIYQAAVEALQLIGDLVLPPAAFHRGADISAKRPEAGLALLPQEIRRDRRK